MTDFIRRQRLPEEGFSTRFVDMADGTHAERVQSLPLTAVAFVQGQTFRTFHEFSLTDGETFVVRVVTSGDLLLEAIALTITTGELRLETRVDGTEGGTFNTALPVIPTNSMSSVPTPAPTTRTTVDTGGTHTGGTLLDVAFIKTDANANRATVVGHTSDDARGVPAGSYYYVLTATGATAGVLNARWEEPL